MRNWITREQIEGLLKLTVACLVVGRMIAYAMFDYCPYDCGVCETSVESVCKEAHHD